jgi:aminopeptidase N
VFRKLAFLAVTTMSAALVPGAAGAAPPQFTAGSTGLGDPYFPLDGNGGYDVQHYGLDLRYDPTTDHLEGTATITARATQNLSRFDLDLQGQTVRSVTVDGVAAAWTRETHELVVTPAAGLRVNRTFTVGVSYEGVPETQQTAFGPIGFIHTDDGALVVAEPDAASTWFPANDHPRDAATVDVTATVPEGLTAVSNGELRGQSTSGGLTTWSWHAAEPMATYLITLAVGHYDLRAYQARGIRFWDALAPGLSTIDPDPDNPGPSAGEVAGGSLARQPEMLDFLSGFLGRYPFRTAGGIVDDTTDLAVALETQTRPIYSPLFFSDPVAGDLVVVHELAHQWLGDLLRLDTWQHTWLNEGFATYAEWLWLEREGIATAQEESDRIAGLLPPEFWQTPVVDPGPALEQMFGDPVYYRGAMTLQALRKDVGDPVFFRILRSWVSANAGSTVTTDEFIALAEKVSGQQLDELFRTWLFTPEKPAELG